MYNIRAGYPSGYMPVQHFLHNFYAIVLYLLGRQWFRKYNKYWHNHQGLMIAIFYQTLRFWLQDIPLLLFLYLSKKYLFLQDLLHYPV
ncbi:hypothetical protein ES705_30796 [subsurface metagenome]